MLRAVQTPEQRNCLHTMQDHPGVTACPLKNERSRQQDTLLRANLSKHGYTPEEATENVSFTTQSKAAFGQVTARRRKVTAGKDGPMQIYEDGKEFTASQIRTDSADNCEGAVPEKKKRDALRCELVPMSLNSLKSTYQGFPQAKNKRREREKRDSQVHDGKGPLRNELWEKSIYGPDRNTANGFKRPEAMSGTHRPVRTRTRPKGSLLVIQDASSEYQMLRRKPLPTTPRRGVLQPPLKALQEQYTVDRPGRQTGKENIPPGQRFFSVCKEGGKDGGLTERPRSSCFVKAGRFSAQGGPCKAEGVCESDGASDQRRLAISDVSDVVVPIQALYLEEQSPSIGGCHSRCHENEDCCSRFKSVKVNYIERIFKPNISIPIPKSTANPLLGEAVFHPERFEEDWLTYQETAMTELINTPFKKADSPNRHRKADTTILRREMMKIYQSTSMPPLYKRLQASLQYGSLSRPKHTLFDHSHTMSDVGFRQQFVHLWTKSYFPYLLTAAVEVVTGRELTANVSDPIASSPGQATKCKALIHDLEIFIESCPLQNNEACPPTDAILIQRCPMVIMLIEKAKVSGLVTRNVFRKSSRQSLLMQSWVICQHSLCPGLVMWCDGCHIWINM